jgi:hypothetical protein
MILSANRVTTLSVSVSGQFSANKGLSKVWLDGERVAYYSELISTSGEVVLYDYFEEVIMLRGDEGSSPSVSTIPPLVSFSSGNKHARRRAKK